MIQFNATYFFICAMSFGRISLRGFSFTGRGGGFGFSTIGGGRGGTLGPATGDSTNGAGATTMDALGLILIFVASFGATGVLFDDPATSCAAGGGWLSGLILNGGIVSVRRRGGWETSWMEAADDVDDVEDA